MEARGGTGMTWILRYCPPKYQSLKLIQESKVEKKFLFAHKFVDFF